MIRTRPATTTDASRLAELAAQWGYPIGAVALPATLARLLARLDQSIVVATDETDAIAGWIHVGEQDLLESGRRAEILGLIVDEQARGQGVGRVLVAEAERWAASRGLTEMSVRSNILRAEAHPFYEAVGYRRIKTQHMYKKSL